MILNMFFAVIVMLVSIEYSGDNILTIYPHLPYMASMIKTGETNGVDVKLKLLKMTPSQWEFELTIHNSADYPAYVMVNPTRTDGSNGHYLTLDKKDGSILEISSHLYPPPPYFLYTNKASVELKLVSPKASCTEALLVRLPLQETLPPFGDKPERIKIDANNIKYARAVIGILPNEGGIRDVLEHKRMGPFVYGLEEMMKGSFKGKRLIDLQTIVYSEILKL